MGLEGSLCRGRELEELARWPNWTADELSAAVGTSAVQFGGGALGAERALERADSRFQGLGRKVNVAALAGRSELKHGSAPKWLSAPV